jgi:DHA1 family 2-module integral membrane pump EmrD-like MFS transporter
MKHSKASLFIIMLILLTSSLGYLSIDLYLPSLPAMAKGLHITTQQSQLTVTIFLISFCCSQLFYGPLSDHYGRRPLLFVGFLLYVFATLLCVKASNIDMLLLGRFFQGLGIGAGAVLSRAMLRDRFSGNELAKMASFLNVGVSTVTTISPALGGFIQWQFGYRANFIALFLIGITILGLLFFSSETNQNKANHNISVKSILSSYLSVISQKQFICNVVCAGIALSALIAYSVANPFIVQTVLGFSPVAYGIFALVIAGCEIIGSLISGYYVEKYGAARLLLYGFLLMLLTGIIMLLLGKYNHSTLLSVLIPTMGAGISIGIILPNASAGAFSIFNSGIGVAGALYGFIQLLITAIASSIVAGLLIQSQLTIGLVIVFLSCIGLLFYYLLVLSNKSKTVNQSS